MLDVWEVVSLLPGEGFGTCWMFGRLPVYCLAKDSGHAGCLGGCQFTAWRRIRDMLDVWEVVSLLPGEGFGTCWMFGRLPVYCLAKDSGHAGCLGGCQFTAWRRIRDMLDVWEGASLLPGEGFGTCWMFGRLPVYCLAKDSGHAGCLGGCQFTAWRRIRDMLDVWEVASLLPGEGFGTCWMFGRLSVYCLAKDSGHAGCLGGCQFTAWRRTRDMLDVWEGASLLPGEGLGACWMFGRLSVYCLAKDSGHAGCLGGCQFTAWRRIRDMLDVWEVVSLLPGEGLGTCWMFGRLPVYCLAKDSGHAGCLGGCQFTAWRRIRDMLDVWEVVSLLPGEGLGTCWMFGRLPVYCLAKDSGHAGCLGGSQFTAWRRIRDMLDVWEVVSLLPGEGLGTCWMFGRLSVYCLAKDSGHAGCLGGCQFTAWRRTRGMLDVWEVVSLLPGEGFGTCWMFGREPVYCLAKDSGHAGCLGGCQFTAWRRIRGMLDVFLVLKLAETSVYA